MITPPNGLLAKMRWRLAITGLVAALLAGAMTFMAQFFAETRTRTASVFVPANLPLPVSDSDALPFVWTYSAEGRSLGTPYGKQDGTPFYPPEVSASGRNFHPAEPQKAQWQTLWYQLLFLDWLQSPKGQQAGYVAALAALFVAWLVFCIDRIHRTKAKLAS